MLKKKGEGRREEESERFKKRCTAFGSGLATSSSPITSPVHPTVFLPGLASESATQKAPILQMRSNRGPVWGEGPGPGREQAESAERGLTRQTFLVPHTRVRPVRELVGQAERKRKRGLSSRLGALSLHAQHSSAGTDPAPRGSTCLSLLPHLSLPS